MTRRTSKRPRRRGPTLLQYAETYLASRDVGPHWQMTIRLRCQRLNEFAGRELRICDLDCELVNAWLVHLQESELSAHTVNSSCRSPILALWNEAFVDGLNDNTPLRVRRIKRPRLIVRAYTHDEIQALLYAASKLHGYDANGNKRSDFWQALIHGAYSTGLRRGDLLAAESKAVSSDGLYTTVQRKTGYRVTVRFSPGSLRYARKLKPVDGLMFPWPYRLDSFTSSFKRVRQHAKLDRGSFCWLRRAAGSYAEAELPGAGPRLLGHRDPGVFRKHYEDCDLTVSKPVEPPPIAPPIDGKRREAC